MIWIFVMVLGLNLLSQHFPHLNTSFYSPSHSLTHALNAYCSPSYSLSKPLTASHCRLACLIHNRRLPF